MAIDMKNLSLPKLGKKIGSSGSGYPTKTHINLIVEDKQERDGKRTALTAVLLIAVVAAFGKFAIYDFYKRVADKEAELGQYTTELSVLQSQLADYDQVQEEYNLYESARMVSDASLVPALDALNLVDKYISPVAAVSSISLGNNVMSLNISGSSLKNSGQLVSTLYEQPIVKNVTVSTASNANNSETTTVTMSITLQVVDETTDEPAA